MVTQTEPSVAPPAASEGTPAASPQEPPVPPQEPGTGAEKGPTDEFWANLSPEARVEFARKLSDEELRQHPSFEETLKRHEQSERDRVRHEQEETDRRRHEQDAIEQRRDDALKVLGDNPSPEAARAAAEAMTLAEYYPDMLEQDDDALRHLPMWSDLTPEEQRAAQVTGRNWGEQRRLRYRALVTAVERVTTEAVEKKFQGQKTGLEKAAFQLGYEGAVRELRGDVPPRVTSGGLPTGGKKYRDMTFEEQGKLSSSEIDTMTQRLLHET